MKSHLYRMVLLGGVLGLLATQAALAGEAVTHEVDNGDIAVSYADLNLASTSGIDLLYRRVKLAANKVCGVENMRVSLDIVRRNRTCVAGAIDNAIGTIDNPRLTAFHQAQVLESSQS